MNIFKNSSKPALKQPAKNQQIATFSMGCFWGPDKFFSSLKGIEDVTVGYTGGEKENPTYYNLGNHSEAVRIIYNPAEISYQDLLKHFWQNHDPTLDTKTQYRFAIFYHNQEQKKLAEKSKEKIQKQNNQKINTTIEKAKKFWPAEAYHQDYLKKSGS